MISTRNLTKTYPEVEAVKQVTLNVRAGEVYGFLGPNGAGKSTTMAMLLGLIKPTSGELSLFGTSLQDDYFAIKNAIGVVGENPYFFDEMTAWEFLSFHADIFMMESKENRINELMETVGLRQYANIRPSEYSRGMRQKLSFVRALLHKPDLLMLDEPVSGLDPHGIRQIRGLIEEQKKSGTTIFISSHILSEIERTADRIAIMHKGKLLVEDNLDGLRYSVDQSVRVNVEVANVPESLSRVLSEIPHIVDHNIDGQHIEIRLDASLDYRAELSSAITASGATIIGMETRKASLEETFMTFTDDNVIGLSKGEVQ
jgi:ABC-2 type transport system ATP-binding protein|tara:strand:- start:1523 stop:2467 length:945 start_codon:yes stop_codon:yes gene_type:complete